LTAKNSISICGTKIILNVSKEDPQININLEQMIGEVPPKIDFPGQAPPKGKDTKSELNSTKGD
jgi:hypothetical protein